MEHVLILAEHKILLLTAQSLLVELKVGHQTIAMVAIIISVLAIVSDVTEYINKKKQSSIRARMDENVS